ncbi:MAG: PilN domain-containing protein [Elusimicrobia bacterium]|nr:PilN domain-containing protein [Elusimicrobiota bacterium]
MQLIKINLLSKENIKKEERKELVWLSLLAMIIAVIFGSLVYFLKVHAYNVVETRINQAQFELTKYESIVKQVEALETMKRSLETKKNVINMLREKGIVYPRFMEDLMSVLPQGISLKTLSTVLQPDGKITVSLSADATDNYPIADFITELTLKGIFSDVELGAITTTRSDKATISSFSMTFSYQRKK